VPNGSLDRVIAVDRGHENRAPWWLGVAKPTKIQETLLPQLYALTPVEFDSAAPTCDRVAQRFGNAADHPERVRRYPSDMTDAEWTRVRSLLPVPGWLCGRGGRPEAYCPRAMLDAIRYLVDNGIKWWAIPADLPPWDRVYAFFRRWRDHGLVREFHDRLRGQVREKLGRDAEPTAGVVDSQSVKADAVVGEDSRGFDGGKLINGRKRHVVVDTLGLLLAVMVTAADVGDRTTTSRKPPANRPPPTPTGRPTTVAGVPRSNGPLPGSSTTATDACATAAPSRTTPGSTPEPPPSTSVD
jgi:transposase